MSERYPGGFITKSPPALNPALGNAAPGIWTMDQVMQAVKNGTWPAYDPYFEYTTLLLHGNGTNGAQNNTFLDSSTNNFTITRNGNTTQGTFSPYGDNWSNYFDGTGDYLASASIGAISGDFTIECWAFISGSGDQALFGMGTAAASGGFFVRYEGNTVPQNLNFYTTTDNLFNVSLTRNFWYHIAFTRQSNSVKCWVNGTQVGSAITISDSFTSAAFYAGAGKVGATVPYNPMTGYISNLRVVAGTALYTSAFTPSTTPLTAVSGTSLLTCQSNRFIDNSSNAFTITRNGDVSVQRFSPFAPTAAYSAATVGGSGYFDGTGDYLTVPDNAAWDVGSGNWTAEAWVFPTASPNQPIIIGQWTSSYAWAMQLTDDSSRNLRGLVYTGSYTDFSGSTPLTLNAWNHCVFTRDGTILRLYLNGVQVATNSFGSGSINTSSSVVSIGADGAGSQPFQGYLSNVRFVNGTCLYPNGTTFTPPTAPLTAITNTQLLCNFTNAGIFDNAMMNDLETVGNAQISTTQSKYGGASMYFDGSGDDLRVVNAGVTTGFGTGDFTVEFWVYANSWSTFNNLVDFRKVNDYFMIAYTSGAIQFYNNGSYRITGGSLSTTTWYHIAVCRSGTSTKMFVNGTQAGSTYTDSSNYPIETVITIGARNDDVGNPFNGYIDDLRITKGYARYTANFTPPTSQLQDQ